MQSQIQFLINGQPHSADGEVALTPLSDYLRDTLGLTGTKIGCGAGDCGACTVLVGRVSGGAFRYEPVNSCIHFLFQLHGAHVVTIEGLAANGCTAVADALAGGYGVQCGFCSPGIVMAMTGAGGGRNSGARTPSMIQKALSGNLCRCTGYQQIIESLSRAGPTDYTLGDIFPDEMVAERLADAPLGPVSLGLGGERSLFLPSSLQEAVAYLAEHPTASIVAGATEMAVSGALRRAGGNILHLGRIPELRETHVTSETVSLGAGAPIAAVGESLGSIFPELNFWLDQFGCPQIRSCATLGGNLANRSPVADCLPFLLAGEADVELVSAGGTSRVSIEEFLSGGARVEHPEIIARVILPVPTAGSVRRLYKISTRRHLDIGAVTAAIATTPHAGVVTRAKVALGGVGPRAIRLKSVEAGLEGKPYSLETFREAGMLAASCVEPMSDLRASGEYRRLVVANLLPKYFWETFREAYIAE